MEVFFSTGAKSVPTRVPMLASAPCLRCSPDVCDAGHPWRHIEDGVRAT